MFQTDLNTTIGPEKKLKKYVFIKIFLVLMLIILIGYGLKVEITTKEVELKNLPQSRVPIVFLAMVLIILGLILGKLILILMSKGKEENDQEVRREAKIKEGSSFLFNKKFRTFMVHTFNDNIKKTKLKNKHTPFYIKLNSLLRQSNINGMVDLQFLQLKDLNLQSTKAVENSLENAYKAHRKLTISESEFRREQTEIREKGTGLITGTNKQYAIFSVFKDGLNLNNVLARKEGFLKTNSKHEYVLKTPVLDMKKINVRLNEQIQAVNRTLSTNPSAVAKLRTFLLKNWDKDVYAKTIASNLNVTRADLDLNNGPERVALEISKIVTGYRYFYTKQEIERLAEYERQLSDKFLIAKSLITPSNNEKSS